LYEEKKLFFTYVRQQGKYVYPKLKYVMSLLSSVHYTENDRWDIMSASLHFVTSKLLSRCWENLVFRGLHLRSSSEFNFVLYLSNVTPALRVTQNQLSWHHPKKFGS